MEIWKRTDRFESVREMVNENFAAMDGALGEKAEVVTGVYVGNGATERTIALGRTPRAVYVATRSGATSSGSSLCGGLALSGYPVVGVNSGEVQNPPVLEIVEGGFLARYRSERVGIFYLEGNAKNTYYHYFAIF